VTVGLAICIPLARRRFVGKAVVESLVNLPLVLPPTVLGYALLVVLGRHSLMGTWYEELTSQPLVFTWHGAVVAACIASLPLFVGQARLAIAAIDSDVVAAARTDGAGQLTLFRHILIPLALPGILAGGSLAFARSLGDFGATLMVAGDTPGVTQTMPLAIYDAVLTGNQLALRNFILISCLLCFFVSYLAAKLTPREQNT
jgi:molybdate transport system permease protein